MSLVDNRCLRLTINFAQPAQYSFIFQNVHKRNQFAELLNLPRYQTLIRKTASFEEESKEVSLSDATVIRSETWASIKYFAMRPDNDSSLWFVSEKVFYQSHFLEIMDR